MTHQFDITKTRAQFPALHQNRTVFLDNAGGSQILKSVADSYKVPAHSIRALLKSYDSIHRYLTESNVQLGATYEIGRLSNEAFSRGYQGAAKYINASPEEIVFGSSTTQLFRNLSYGLKFEAGDEIILSKLDHEANIASWLGLAERNKLKVQWWAPKNATNPKLEAAQLDELLTERTRLVACTHVSNILGTIHDIKSIARKVHTIPGALLVVDGVAHCPHRAVDVKQLEVDFYSFSWYKVYGPHMATLYASSSVLPRVGSLGHYFNEHDSLNGKLGLAGTNYELIQSIPTLVEYFGEKPAETWSAIAAHEQKLSQILLDFLNAHPRVTVRGEKSPDSQIRVPTISFTCEGRSSKSIVEEADAKSNLGFRWGHFYAKRLITDVLGLDDEGVVRVSAVHYNSEEEMQNVVALLRDVLG